MKDIELYINQSDFNDIFSMIDERRANMLQFLEASVLKK